MLHEQIKNNMKSAMLARDTIELETLRSVLAGFTNELVAKGRKPSETLSDEEALTVIARLAKQRKDSIEQFTKGGREDLVKNEEAQLIILEGYLPKLMDIDEIRQIVNAKKEKLGITDAKDRGLLMKEVMADLKGKADGKMVKEVVDSLF